MNSQTDSYSDIRCPFCRLIAKWTWDMQDSVKAVFGYHCDQCGDFSIRRY